MSPHVVTIAEEMKIKNQTKTKIGVGSVVKATVGELEKIKMEGRSGRMRKEVVGCVKAVLGKKKFLVQFEYGQKKYISYYLRRLIRMRQYHILPKNNNVNC